MFNILRSVLILSKLAQSSVFDAPTDLRRSVTTGTWFVHAARWRAVFPSWSWGGDVKTRAIMMAIMLVNVSQPSDLDLPHVEAVFQQPQSNPVQAFVE